MGAAVWCCRQFWGGTHGFGEVLMKVHIYDLVVLAALPSIIKSDILHSCNLIRRLYRVAVLQSHASGPVQLIFSSVT